MKIDFGQFVHALSDTVDLVGVDELQHGKRVGFMVLESAKILGMDSVCQQRLFRIGLLHDCGVSSTKVHRKLVDELDWTEADQHCRIGARRMEQFAPLAGFAEIIRYHHTRWRDLEKMPIPPETKRDANLIYLLDRVDALAGMYGNDNRLAIKEQICQKIDTLRNNYFQSELVDVFFAAAEKEAFWITQEPNHLKDFLRIQLGEADEVCLDTEELKEMARLFAEIVDAKSPYTAEHSLGVACLAGFLAKNIGLSERVCGEIEVAALLHDIGKMQIPDKILEYSGGLEGEDLALMRHHSYVTMMILGKIEGFEEIASWASNHHEKLDGSGYPFKKKADDLSIESRIITVADIFQALAQNRPYRVGLSQDAIVEIINRYVDDGKVDTEIARIVDLQTANCYEIATPAIAPF